MNTRSTDKDSDSIASDDVLAALDRILKSEDFVSAPRLSSLLHYIVTETVAGRSTKLKGFNIANSVFGRDETFDARTDPLVRVQANRLRKAMERYYLTGGKNDPVRISVPKGSYAAVFGRPDAESDRSGISSSKPTLCVLPFQGIGGGNEQQYFASGITEELTTALAQVENFQVVGGRSTQFADAAGGDPLQIGKKLNVRFVMEGAVQKGADSFRVTAQLTDAQTGLQLWAQRFDRSLDTEKLFELQDEISHEVIGHVADAYGVIPRLLEKETRGKRAHDLESYDAVLRFYHYQACPSVETYERARRGLELAVDRDPDYAMASATLSELYSDNYGLRFVEPYNLLDRAYELARHAIAQDPSCQQAHYSMAMAQFHRRERPGCLEALRRVLELNPNAPYYAGAAGWLMSLAGDWDRGLAMIQKSSEQNPFHPTWFFVAPFEYHFGRQEYEEALKFAEAVNLPGLTWDPLIRAAALQRNGRDEEANALVKGVVDSVDGFPSIAREYLGGYIFEDALADDMYSALVDAGLPQPS